MIKSQDLIDKICAKIAAGGLTALETCQTDGALALLTAPVVSVATFSTLPSAVEYAGRMIYVDNENTYYHAVSGVWLKKLDSSPFYYRNDIWAWGDNFCGKIGDGTTVSKSSPVSVVGGFTDWCQVSSGGSTLAVRANGTLWAWGANNYGQLGDGTTVAKSSPVSVVGGFTDWCQVAQGGFFSLGLRTNGTAWGWGNNIRGQLGDGTTFNQSSPVSVIGGFTDWTRLEAASTRSSFGLRTNGTLWSWGCNSYGQLGDGTITSRLSPVSVVGGFTNWCQVSSGYKHTLGLRTNGTLWAWGYNGFNNGRLGDGTITDRSSPVSVIGGFTDWCRVSAGYANSFAIRTNGTLWSWGSNFSGSLGDNSVINKCSPISVVGGFTDWCQLSTVGSTSQGIRTNGTIWAWGSNSSGDIGDGTTVARSSPVSVIGGFTDWSQISDSSALRKVCKGF